jgi:hypothetical protein
MDSLQEIASHSSAVVVLCHHQSGAFDRHAKVHRKIMQELTERAALPAS